jgi:membrane protease YdiL (CAAX protease family)
MATAPWDRLNWRILISAGVFNYSTLLGGPLGEEPGWRGFALPRLELRYGPLGGTLLLALIWAGWHLPLFLRPGWESAPLWIYVLILIGLSVIMTFIANLTRFSLFAAICLHAIFNTVSRFLGGLFLQVQPSSSLPFELVMALCGLVVAGALALLTKSRLGWSHAAW